MNEFFTTLAKEGRKGGLSLSEKSAMLARLRSEMKAYPAGSPRVISLPTSGPVRSPYAFMLSRAFLAPAVFMLLVIGGASAYAAEGSLPGDLLYPIKVSVNEPVREALAFSAEAKADWHAEAVGRRLREAETLALRGELSASKSAEIEADFDQHISMVEVFLGAVESNSPLKAAEISARFAGSLAAYGSDLLHAGLKSVDVASRNQTDSLAEHVKTKQAELVSPNRIKASSAVRTKFKPSSALPSREATAPSQSTQASGDVSNTLMSLKDLEEDVVASLAQAELSYDGLRPHMGGDANREVEKRVADIRDLLSKTDSSDEKSRAASLERVQLALKHIIGLEAFLRGHKDGATTSSTPSSSSGTSAGASVSGTLTAPVVPVNIPLQSHFPVGL